jgi:hypothetical protein
MDLHLLKGFKEDVAKHLEQVLSVWEANLI